MPKKADISFNITPNSGVPIFRQIIELIERLIACGVLKGGDLLPSVNEVSRQLAVNPMTISRAYNLLHERGLLIRLRGIGMQVAGDATKSMDERLEMLSGKINEVWVQAKQLGLNKKEVVEYITQSMEAEI
jgi:GntR family transcriptional regulator